ncbi:MAG: hypothetical protein WB623_24565, partial [Candidatus Sulfotelmatobacter sp.]
GSNPPPATISNRPTCGTHDFGASGASPSKSFDVAGHQQNPGAEQHGEDRHELFVCQDMTE